jgi:hypothetical protein
MPKNEKSKVTVGCDPQEPIHLVMLGSKQRAPLTHEQIAKECLHLPALKYVPIDHVTEIVLQITRAVEKAHNITEQT